MIDGTFYLAGQSDFCPAKLYLQAGGFQLHAEGLPAVMGSIDELSVAHRLGNIARKITLPDGSVFETKDNDAIDSALSNNDQSSGFMGFVHILERNMALAIFSIFITIGVVFASFKWGLPAASHVVAHALPNSANQAISGNVLAFLDEYFLEETQLDEKQQEKIRQHFFNSIVPLYQVKDAPQFKLHFRLWPLGDNGSIPNALALPSGDIVVTDRFIELAQSQDEIDIVLLHEMGHVIGRHSLEKVIEGSAIVIAVSVAFGDVSWLADMGVGIGSFLISSSYSRGHEADADLFAYKQSLKAGINPASLGLILTRMEQDMSEDPSLCGEKNKQPKSKRNKSNNDPSLSSFFSSHPSSADRIAMGKRFQTCFEQGLTLCPETTPK
jgi:Zn-dependent protease with chaperone function